MAETLSKEEQDTLKRRLLKARKERERNAATGFTQFERTVAEVQQRAAEPHSSASAARTQPATTTERRPQLASGRSLPSFSGVSSQTAEREALGMGPYWILLGLGLLNFFLKMNFSFYQDQISSVAILVATAFFFWIMIRGLPNYRIKESVLLIAIMAELLGGGLLGFLPDTSLIPFIKDILFGVHAYAWALTGVLFFVMGAIEVKEAGRKLGLITGLALLGFVALGFFFFAPSLLLAPWDYQQQSHQEYLAAIEQQLEAGTKQVKEGALAFYDPLLCRFSTSTSTATLGAYDDCLKSKKITRFCKANFETVGERTKCEEEQRKTVVAVRGIDDPTRSQPMKAEFIVSEFFPKESYFTADSETTLTFPIQLKIANPRQQSFTVDVSCAFRQGTYGEEIPGKIIGAGQMEIEGIETEGVFVCEAPPLEEGSYTLIFKAEFPHLLSVSRLQRAFIGEKDLFWKRQWIDTIRSEQFSGGAHLSQAPADFVKLHFAFGSPLENPIIERTSGIVLSGSVENTGGGEIKSLSHYALDLPGFSLNDLTCLEGSLLIPAPSKSKPQPKRFYLPTCVVEQLPADLEDPSDYVLREFFGEIEYSYIIRKEVPVSLQAVAFVVDVPTGEARS